MQFEVALSPVQGVVVTFKLDEGATKQVMEEATLQACEHLRTGTDTWREWSDENATEEEAQWRRMQDEQRALAVEQWEEQKEARRRAATKLRGI